MVSNTLSTKQFRSLFEFRSPLVDKAADPDPVLVVGTESIGSGSGLGSGWLSEFLLHVNSNSVSSTAGKNIILI